MPSHLSPLACVTINHLSANYVTLLLTQRTICIKKTHEIAIEAKFCYQFRQNKDRLPTSS